MKDLDKGKCVRPARSAHRGTDHLNGIVALSEKSTELGVNWRVGEDYCARSAQALKTQASKFKDSPMAFYFYLFLSNALTLVLQV